MHISNPYRQAAGISSGDTARVLSSGTDRVGNFLAEGPRQGNEDMDIVFRWQIDEPYRLLFEKISDGIIATDLKGIILFANPAAATLLDRRQDELLGRPIGFPVIDADFAEISFIRKDGKAAVAELRVARADWHGEPAYLLSLRDTTLRSNSETRDIPSRTNSESVLLRSEKLATAGRMAASIAHEINNPLAATMNSLFLALQDPSLSEATRQKLKVAERELKRIAHFTKQAVGFYKETGKCAAVKIPELIDEVLELFVSKLTSKSINVIRKHRGVPCVQALEGVISQIVSNLVANSIDAVPANGTIHIRTACPVLLNGRPMMQLTIADTGAGISKKNRSRVFEAFFTTKESTGTGLGLWVTGELVRKHEGKIRFRSCVGKGSVFTVWIPTACCE